MRTITTIFLSLILSATLFAQVGIHPQATASGTDTYTASISTVGFTYATGQRIMIKFTNHNTGACTINITPPSGTPLGPKAIKKNGTEALAANDIKDSQILLLVYDGTNWQVVGGGGGSVLYTSTGSNTDGSMDQNSTTIALATKQGTLTNSAGLRSALSDETGTGNAVFSDGATLTGTVVLPSTTSIGTVSSTEIGYSDGVTSAIQGQIDLKVDKEDFATLIYGSVVIWATASKQNPLAKLTATNSFTIDITNVKSGAYGVLKLVKNSASNVVITFDTDFTNKTQNTSLPNYTLTGSSGSEYILSFIADGTSLEWVIGDIAATTSANPYALVRRLSTVQSIPDNTITPISFDTEVTDASNIFTSGTPTRLTVPGSGNKLATISVLMDYAINSTNLRRIWIYKNGSAAVGGLAQVSNLQAVYSTTMQNTFQIECSGGDYFEISAYHNVGSSINVNSCTVAIKIESRL